VIRRIAVVTGTRADYGLLRWTMAEIAAHDGLELRVIVTGSHLSDAFGSTWTAIENDGFAIDERVEILGGDDSPLGIVEATARATAGIAGALQRLAPDLVLVLGDRYEILAAAQAALLLGLPLAHIAGGEVTEGAVDDAIRHAITKMAQLHFPAADDYRRRVIQLGEHPDRVHDVGATGLDNFERLALLDRDALATDLGLTWDDRPLVVCTFHPETLDGATPAEALAGLFAALGSLDVQVLFTKANADSGGREINRLVDAFVASHSDRMWAFASLGQVRYLSLLQVADVVVGNSSSGIIEAPAAGTPTVNIGGRQDGRMRAPSIIDVPNVEAAIRAGIQRALEPAARAAAAERRTPYGTPGAARRIVDVLATTELAVIRVKKFYSEGADGA
jgi:UDP-N-acetylglucosamine 2-epimerase (non-hydrolysing)